MFRKVGLTKREAEVLVLSADGDTKAEVGEVLGITEQTVRGYCKNLTMKLGAKNMVHAVSIAYQNGVLVQEDSEPYDRRVRQARLRHAATDSTPKK